MLRVAGKTVERGKQRVNMFLDSFIVEYFKAKAGDRVSLIIAMVADRSYPAES